VNFFIQQEEFMENPVTETPISQGETKFCQHCGQKIPKDAVLCTLCGRMVETQPQNAAPQVIIHNDNINTNTNVNKVAAAVEGKMKNKWVSVTLCFFLGIFGAHKFYEGKIGMGILYLFTVGLFGIGVLVDFIVLLFKSNPYLP